MTTTYRPADRVGDAGPWQELTAAVYRKTDDGATVAAVSLTPDEVGEHAGRYRWGAWPVGAAGESGTAASLLEAMAAADACLRGVAG